MQGKKREVKQREKQLQLYRALTLCCANLLYHDRTCWRVGCGERERGLKLSGDMDHIDGETEFSKEENQEGSHLNCCCLPQSFPAGAANLQLGSSSPEEMPILW